MTLQELKLINKALRAFPNSPEQLKIRKQIEKLKNQKQVTMGNTTYNGWTNYETWRVNLEIFEDIDSDDIIDYFGRDVDQDALEEYVDDVVFGDFKRNTFSLLEGYANAFLSEVNYWEIRQHLMDQINEEDE